MVTSTSLIRLSRTTRPCRRPPTLRTLHGECHARCVRSEPFEAGTKTGTSLLPLVGSSLCCDPVPGTIGYLVLLPPIAWLERANDHQLAWRKTSRYVHSADAVVPAYAVSNRHDAPRRRPIWLLIPGSARKRNQWCWTLAQQTDDDRRSRREDDGQEQVIKRPLMTLGQAASRRSAPALAPSTR